MRIRIWIRKTDIISGLLQPLSNFVKVKQQIFSIFVAAFFKEVSGIKENVIRRCSRYCMLPRFSLCCCFILADLDNDVADPKDFFSDSDLEICFARFGYGFGFLD
jgi:hypothetical protein